MYLNIKTVQIVSKSKLHYCKMFVQLHLLQRDWWELAEMQTTVLEGCHFLMYFYTGTLSDSNKTNAIQINTILFVHFVALVVIFVIFWCLIPLPTFRIWQAKAQQMKCEVSVTFSIWPRCFRKSPKKLLQDFLRRLLWSTILLIARAQWF